MKASTILGIIGGIFGIFGGLFAVMFGSVFDEVGSEKTTIATQGWVAIAASILAIFASVQIKEKSKMWGWILIISGITGLIAISFFYILPAVLLIIAGILALNKKSIGT